jgi:hypothetical protein
MPAINKASLKIDVVTPHLIYFLFGYRTKVIVPPDLRGAFEQSLNLFLPRLTDFALSLQPFGKRLGDSFRYRLAGQLDKVTPEPVGRVRLNTENH